MYFVSKPYLSCLVTHYCSIVYQKACEHMDKELLYCRLHHFSASSGEICTYNISSYSSHNVRFIAIFYTIIIAIHKHTLLYFFWMLGSFSCRACRPVLGLRVMNCELPPLTAFSNMHKCFSLQTW